MSKNPHTAPVFVYLVKAPNGQTYRTAAPSIDNAQEGIEARYGFDAGSCKARTLKIDGEALRITLHPMLVGRAGLKPTEQCWAPVDFKSDVRCQNPARDGYHTCKIHTLFEAPAPFGSPEYVEWIEGDDDLKPARRRTRRSQRTRAGAKGTAPDSATKPANRVSAARKRRPKP